MKNKISRQYFRVLPIRCVSRKDVFAMILYDASCPTALLEGNTFSIKLDLSLVPSRPRRFRKWRHLSSLSEKFAEDALGSKTPLVTQIARTGLGTRLVRSLLGRRSGDWPHRLRVGGHVTYLVPKFWIHPLINCKYNGERKSINSLVGFLGLRLFNSEFFMLVWIIETEMTSRRSDNRSNL